MAILLRLSTGRACHITALRPSRTLSSVMAVHHRFLPRGSSSPPASSPSSTCSNLSRARKLLPPLRTLKAKKAVSFRGHDRREAVVDVRQSVVRARHPRGYILPLAADCSARTLVLEDDDDIELLERVKDGKKRLERRIKGSSAPQTPRLGICTTLIYKLSKVGQAIDKNDLPVATSVLGPSSDAKCVQNFNAAFSKVNKLDAEFSKSAFVSSATSLDNCIALAKLSGQLKGY